MRVIKDGAVQEDAWRRLEAPELPVPPGDWIVPFPFWREHQERLVRHDGRLAVCLDGGDRPEDLSGFLDRFQLIALEFPVFRDGRCYSHARLLRERFGFQGELRAVGDVLRDQLFFMRRCGIDSFQVKDGKDAADALKGLADFSIAYQEAADGALPVPERRRRERGED